MRTLTDDSTREILVYDWRAPVSSLFYQGETGRASYKAPCGEITGEIKRLRQYTFANGEIKNYWDTQLQINDTILRDVLSGASSESMKPIVCTIQREQNSAIRFDTKKNLAVFGPAGCGKTSIGMHRAAWLMYDMRTAGLVPSILMFTANEAFASYISGVLPELGETQTQTTSFYELFEKHLADFNIEKAINQTEAIIMQKKNRIKNINQLSNPDFLSFAENKIKNLSAQFKSVMFFGETVLSAEEINRKFNALPKHVPVKSRLNTIADWVKENIENYMLINKKELLNKVLHTTDTGDSYTQRYKNLKDTFLNKTIQMVLNSTENNACVLLKNFLNEFYGDEPNNNKIINRINSKNIFFEEALMLLYINTLLGNCKTKSSPTHILIDEAQDMCVLQHKIIKALYPKAVFTLLGDVNQGIAPVVNTSNETTLCEIYMCDKIKLNKSYRSTKNISEFAKQYLPENAASYETFERFGKEPGIIKTDDYIKTAAEIIKNTPENYNSVGIVLKTAELAQSFCEKLKKYIPDCKAITDENTKINGKIICIPAALVKGLEFDSVIIPFAEAIEKDKRLMYLFTTRALHELHILYNT